MRHLSLCPSLLRCLSYQDNLEVPECSARRCIALDNTCCCDLHHQTYCVEDFSIHRRSGRTVLPCCFVRLVHLIFAVPVPHIQKEIVASPQGTSTIDKTVTLLKERIGFFLNVLATARVDVHEGGSCGLLANAQATAWVDVRVHSTTRWLKNWLSFLWEAESSWRVDDVHGRSLSDSLSPCSAAAQLQLTPIVCRLPLLFPVAPVSSALCPSRRVENDSSNFACPRPDHQSQASRQ